MNKKQFLILSIVVVSIGIVIFFVIPTMKENKKRVQSFFAMTPQEIRLFQIYPRVGTPSGKPIKFTPSDPLVSDFFQAISDHQSYPLSRDTVEKDRSWFIELADQNLMLQLQCYIPYQKGEIVVVVFADIDHTGGSYYGDFQSDLLYQWYQKYSHRWLNPR
jgi:hypothetical protein